MLQNEPFHNSNIFLFEAGGGGEEKGPRPSDMGVTVASTTSRLHPLHFNILHLALIFNFIIYFRCN